MGRGKKEAQMRNGKGKERGADEEWERKEAERRRSQREGRRRSERGRWESEENRSGVKDGEINKKGDTRN